MSVLINPVRQGPIRQGPIRQGPAGEESIGQDSIGDVDFAFSGDLAMPETARVHWPLRLVLGLLVLAPLGFGATSVRGSLLLTAGAWLIFLIWVAAAIRNERWRWHSLVVTGPAFLLLAFTALHWVAPVSANPAATQLEWLRWVGVIVLAFVAAESVLTASQLRWMCTGVACAGLVIALFAIAQYLTSNGKIYWLVEPSQGGWIFGPYVNRNHFAGLMELWIPVALGLALMPGNTFLQRWQWWLVALVMGIAVALSGSRGGVIAVGVELLLIAFAAAALRGRRAVTALGVAVALIFGAVAVLGRGEIFERYKQSLQIPRLQQEEASALRIQAWRGSLAIFRQHPIAGSGLDTFVTHFPAVRSFSSDKVWTHAHNDYLQFLAETGLIGAGLAGWILVAGGREAWRNVRRTHETASGALLIGIACACIGFMVHGWLDFNFHVPANAANFAVLGAVLTRPNWDED